MEARIWAVYVNDVVAQHFDYKSGDKTKEEFLAFIEKEQESLITEGYSIKKVQYFFKRE